MWLHRYKLTAVVVNQPVCCSILQQNTYSTVELKSVMEDEEGQAEVTKSRKNIIKLRAVENVEINTKKSV